MWSLFQPKWQPDDYYVDNFRLSKGDGVTVYYKDNETAAAAATTTAFKSTGQKYLETGSISLSASVALAFTAAALMH